MVRRLGSWSVTVWSQMTFSGLRIFMQTRSTVSGPFPLFCHAMLVRGDVSRKEARLGFVNAISSSGVLKTFDLPLPK